MGKGYPELKFGAPMLPATQIFLARITKIRCSKKFFFCSKMVLCGAKIRKQQDKTSTSSSAMNIILQNSNYLFNWVVEMQCPWFLVRFVVLLALFFQVWRIAHQLLTFLNEKKRFFGGCLNTIMMSNNVFENTDVINVVDKIQFRTESFSSPSTAIWNFWNMAQWPIWIELFNNESKLLK